MSKIENGNRPPAPEISQERAIKIIESEFLKKDFDLYELLEKLSGWKPTFSDLQNLLSEEMIPLDIAFEIASRKLDKIMPRADADTLSLIIDT
ncbi:hypothetical protein COU95_00610 [Candidatus Shapirobacteria bacterium CG10_big_fil_rev_8_21_14_0_10_40_9]|uniref:Uncharacterized protein n=1 Tax=Candidatus Shapirobacteria bacterium CG10_big_fil_rev_8_21_14_0_10_40_9 TaxID=1974888 RepID=A0A2M8L4A0_9BACT|nr:MAG: hypothetical protein COU95_00610 [Candidatus Shapirobacteria bacterium CG10_big_fil_rev_8_21_14_0_10_40_9]